MSVPSNLQGESESEKLA